MRRGEVKRRKTENGEEAERGKRGFLCAWGRGGERVGQVARKEARVRAVEEPQSAARLRTARHAPCECLDCMPAVATVHEEAPAIPALKVLA